MPRRSPFTTVASRLALLAQPKRADLHVHTTSSDGEFTPTQVIALAREANLAAVAITDHDTLAAVGEARAAIEDSLEFISGVEISAGFQEREVHLLGYFVRTDHEELNAALAQLCERRRERYRDFVSKLAACGFALPEERVKAVEDATVSLGRRHVAALLVACGFAKHRTEAFHWLLKSVAGSVIPKRLIPIEEAIRLVHAAGGVTSLAHPPSDITDTQCQTLVGFGLDALEVEYPWGRKSPKKRLREFAGRFGLAISGGSDCHGPIPRQRRIGSNGITSEELQALRERCKEPGSTGS